ncbi:helix-turn-helix transcriptional regulator [Streptomyces sp. NPDC046237]|uniref:helix-turn-helix transcriptional regulator n=1 Tax=Streptomyces sp. NPDC046237 TaxID=3154914 RepID=UPI00340975DD
MHDDEDGRGAALAELRRQLAIAIAVARLNQTQLAARCGLGRTTVSVALSPTKPVPSPQTVAAIASALKLPIEELKGLLELRRMRLIQQCPAGPFRAPVPSP